MGPEDYDDDDQSGPMFVDDGGRISAEKEAEPELEILEIYDIPRNIRDKWERNKKEKPRQAWQEHSIKRENPFENPFDASAFWEDDAGENAASGNDDASNYEPSDADESEGDCAAARRRRKKNSKKRKAAESGIGNETVTLEVAPPQRHPRTLEHGGTQQSVLNDINIFESLRLQRQTLERSQTQPGFSDEDAETLRQLDEELHNVSRSLGAGLARGARGVGDARDARDGQDNESVPDGASQGNQNLPFVQMAFAPPVENLQQRRRRAFAKTAEEYWKQNVQRHQNLIHRFSAHGHQGSLRDDDNTEENGEASRPTRRGPRASRRDPRNLASLNLLLEDHDPIAARAAMEADEDPGATEKATRDDLWKKVRAHWNKDRDVLLDMGILSEAVKSFGFWKCMRADKENWLWKLDGMKTPLYNHQVVGAAWMLGREFSPTGCRGGILGDEMGLGKTIEMLACMASNPRTEQQKHSGMGGTLLIVPASVVRQWTNEIARHSNFRPPVHYKRAITTLLPNEVWTEWDIVIASYHDVARAFPSDRFIRNMISEDVHGETWRAKFHNHLGQIFKIKWHRVVLDEAHAIKTVTTQTSQACCSLDARYRWAITGTPIHNSVLELFPYLDFLRDVWAGDFKEFRKRFEMPNADLTELNNIVGEIMIRRRTSGWWMGRHLVDAPEPYPTQDYWISQTVEEEVFYRQLEDSFRRVINHKRSDGTLTISYIGLFAYITYLRQLTAHLFVGEQHMRKHYTQADVNYIRGELQAVQAGTNLIDHVDRLYAELQKTLSSVGDAQDEEPEEEICTICREIAVEPSTGPCGHSFCIECLEAAINDSRHRGDNEYRCPRCGRAVPDITKANGPSKGKKGKVIYKRQRGDDFQGWRLATMPSFFLKEYIHQPTKPLPHSSKTDAVMGIIQGWRRDAPDDKIIIFTQWRVMGKLLGMMLEDAGLQFVYLFGGMGDNARDGSINTFRDNPDVPIMISSLQTGGQGLNLTCANRVVLVDLWWNRAMERQAFSRVDRIGQTKRCHSVRIIMQDTIDGRLYRMQKCKEAAVRRTLGEQRDADLTVEEMVQLLGRVDDEGDVHADYDEDEDEPGPPRPDGAAEGAGVGGSRRPPPPALGSGRNGRDDGDDENHRAGRQRQGGAGRAPGEGGRGGRSLNINGGDDRIPETQLAAAASQVAAPDRAEEPALSVEERLVGLLARDIAHDDGRRNEGHSWDTQTVVDGQDGCSAHAHGQVEPGARQDRQPSPGRQAGGEADGAIVKREGGGGFRWDFGADVIVIDSDDD